MLKIRSGVFETNSSSSHTFIYDRELKIPARVDLSNNGDGTLNYYYANEGPAFIRWLMQHGVKQVYVDQQLVEQMPEEEHAIKMYNSACEAHNDDIDEEQILLYVLFGKIIREFDDDPESAKPYMNDRYVWSDWFI